MMDELLVEAEHFANLLFASDSETGAIGNGEVVIEVLAKDLQGGLYRAGPFSRLECHNASTSMRDARIR